MRLFEFADDDPLRVKLTGVATQLKSENKQPMPLEHFMEILRANQISLDEGDLYDLIKKDPLVNIIDSIEDKKVIFKGQEGSKELDDSPDENAKIRQQMASKQVK